MSENLEKKKALEMAMSQIEKQFGKGSVMKLGEFKAMEVEAIPTGALSLDMALGIGGVPRGRIIEVFGPESSGKTTLALHIVAEAQKMGGDAAFIDAEHALDPVYAKKLGVDIDNLIVSQPDTGEQALEITESLVRSGALDDILNSAKDINGVKTIAYGLEGVDGNALRDLADKIRSKMGSGVVVLVSNLGDKVNLITMATKDVLDKGIHCGKIIKEVATIVGGGGGGRPDMAQAGGKKPENIPQAIEAAFQTVENLVK